MRSFDDLMLTELEQQTISIRGFLYQTAEKQWILAADPDLKSCCVGSHDKARRQIYLEDELFLPGQPAQAITLQGRFHHTDEGPPYYWLSEVTVVAESTSWGAYTFAGVIIIGIALALYFKNRLK